MVQVRYKKVPVQVLSKCKMAKVQAWNKMAMTTVAS
jgi:hypothetical protein